MKLIKIIGYLMVIVTLEGALQEYLRVNSSHSHAGVHHVGHRNLISDESKKELAHSWYEIIMLIIQSLWALVINTVKSIWDTIRTWIELMLIAFECSELVHKLGERFNLWEGLHHIKLG